MASHPEHWGPGTTRVVQSGGTPILAIEEDQSSCLERCCNCFSFSRTRARTLTAYVSEARGRNKQQPLTEITELAEHEVYNVRGQASDKAEVRKSVTEKTANVQVTNIHRIRHHHIDDGRKQTDEDVPVDEDKLEKFRELYEIQGMLARGGFGTTYKAVEKSSGRVVVVKKPDDVADHADFNELKDKMNPHVVRVFDFFSSEAEGTHIVMEYCAGGDLYNAFWSLSEREGSISESWCAAIFKQIIEGVQYLHKQFDQSHNDIKPENVLLDHEPKDGKDVPRTMIADFGCAASYGTGMGGDPRYCPFEVLNGAAPTKTTDVWSLGVTLYELLTGDLLFVDHHNISGWQAFSEAQNGKLLVKLNKAWEDINSGKLKIAMCAKVRKKETRGFVQEFLHVDPAKRIKLKHALENPWFELATSLHEEHPLDADICLNHATRNQNFKLRAGLLELVQSKLQGEHMRHYQVQWDRVDTDHNGTLDYKEFETFWNSMQVNTKGPKPSAKALFNIVDVDMSGDISFDEFVAFTFDPRKMDAETREQYLTSAFCSICGDDHLLQLPELEEFFSEEVKPFVSVLFDEIDNDKNGEIDYKEFSKYILHLCEP